jgi:hypothetical protein
LRLGHDCGPRMLGAVSRRYRRVVLPQKGRVVLAAELGRFAADADTAPGFRKRLHNRCTLFPAYRPGVMAAEAVATQEQVALTYAQ